jgi:RNA-splicing ligase RtcB
LPPTRKPRRDSIRGRTSPANSGDESKLLAPTVSTFTARIGSCGGGAGEQAARARTTRQGLRLDRRKRSLGKGMANLLEEGCGF